MYRGLLFVRFRLLGIAYDPGLMDLLRGKADVGKSCFFPLRKSLIICLCRHFTACLGGVVTRPRGGTGRPQEMGGAPEELRPPHAKDGVTGGMPLVLRRSPVSKGKIVLRCECYYGDRSLVPDRVARERPTQTLLQSSVACSILRRAALDIRFLGKL